MSRIRVNIDRIVFNGFEPAERKALVEGLRSELVRVLGDRGVRGEWAPHRTEVLRLRGMSFEPGPTGNRRFGAGLGRAIGRGLKP
jgi:hypothetical protein